MFILRRFIHLLDKIDRRLTAVSHPPAQASRNLSLEAINSDTLDFASPCFVLSTGRCGTLWLSELFRLSSFAYVNHSDSPELLRYSRLAYEQYNLYPELFWAVLRATRDEWLIEAYRRMQIYIETNNRITFFAYAIRQVYPNARFIHLVRHPGDFVRSGLSRGWYQQHSQDIARIWMCDTPQTWQTLSDVEKIAWLWNETNSYIEKCLTALPQESYLQVRAEDMFSKVSLVEEMLEFIGLNDVSPKTISKMQKRRINSQRVWKLASFSEWDTRQREDLCRYVTLAEKYNYSL